MQVTLFARVDPTLNPYLLLYKSALEKQGLIVQLEREFGLRWLIAKGKSCDVIHLHWIEALYKPARRPIWSGLLGKLMQNRLMTPLRGAIRLANVSATLLLAKLQGKIIVYTIHNVRPHHKKEWPLVILNRLAHRIVFFVSENVHAHSHYARNIVKKVYRNAKVTVVPHGNYITHYVNQISRRGARQQLGVPEDAFVYLFLGMIRPYKGVPELIDAFRKLDLPAGQLLIVGRASSASYEKEISDLSLGNPAIQLIPEFVPDESIQIYMNACDICVLPYRDTTTSGAAMLSLSFGRPIIAPAIASFPELITPETGILYDPARPDALKSALQHAAQRSWPESRILAYVHQFDWDTLGPRLAGLYRARPDKLR